MSMLKSIVSSFFEGMVAGNFKTAADGQRLFYPWGVFGKGYVLPDAQTEQRIRKSLKIYHMIWLPLLIVFAGIAGPYSFYYSLVFAPVFLLILYSVYGVFVRSLTRGLPTHSERLRVTESWANSARSYSSALLWALFTVSALFVISGIGLILDGEVGIGLLGILFFGACSLVYAYMLRKRA